MSEPIVLRRWLAWNARREGQKRIFPAGHYARLYYIGPVLYYDDRPIARLVKQPDGNLVCLTLSGKGPSNPKKWENDGEARLAKTIVVACIGVHSALEGDMLSEAELVTRFHEVCLKEQEHILATAAVMPIGRFVHRGYADHIASMTRKLGKIAERHKNYSDALELGWKPIPDRVDELQAIVNRRLADYNDPKKTKQRETAQARKMARKALDL